MTKISPCVPSWEHCVSNAKTYHLRRPWYSTGEIMPPQRSYLVLAADIPDVELDVLVCYRLDVETDSRNGGNILIELQLVENC